MRHLLLLPLLALLALPASAQQAVPVLMKVSAGTGFFINNQGDFITNAHVVTNCKSISIKPAQGERPATLRAIDAKRDLAVLRVEGGNIPAIASLRWNIRDLRVGDGVVVMGYPGSEGMAGQYRYKKSTVQGLQGPIGEPSLLQLDSVAEHGNSGGPVLDTSGNVIAVITGNAFLYRKPISNTGQVGEPQLMGKSDVAVTLPVLEDFLRGTNTTFFQSSSGMVMMADTLLERRANKFIVPVRCYLGPA